MAETKKAPKTDMATVEWLKSFLPAMPLPRTKMQWAMTLIAGLGFAVWQTGYDPRSALPTYAKPADIAALRGEFAADFAFLKEKAGGLSARLDALEKAAPKTKKPTFTGIAKPAR